MNQNNMNAFGAEMSVCQHFVQICDTDEVFMDTLAGSIGGGLSAGDVVVIATPGNRHELAQAIDGNGARCGLCPVASSVLSLDAEETLSRFMVDGWPDKKLFADVVTDVIDRAGRNGRRIHELCPSHMLSRSISVRPRIVLPSLAYAPGTWRSKKCIGKRLWKVCWNRSCILGLLTFTKMGFLK